jgi:hypothetical protein
VLYLYIRYSEGEIRFNLMALVTDRKTVYSKELKSLLEVCFSLFRLNYHSFLKIFCLDQYNGFRRYKYESYRVGEFNC